MERIIFTMLCSHFCVVKLTFRGGFYEEKYQKNNWNPYYAWVIPAVVYTKGNDLWVGGKCY